MERIKRIIRERLPETNSSSSHSVVISTKKNYEADETLKLNSDGDLVIPSTDFGWEWEKYNSCMPKLQYVVGILMSSGNTKSLKKLIDMVKDMTGANRVLIDMENPIEIDHNSSDIFPEIIESSETIKSFIFSKNSWLYTGNDNSEEPDGFYNIEEDSPEVKPKAIVTIEFGGTIGNLDIELYNYPLISDNNVYLSNLTNDECYSRISYNFLTKEFGVFSDNSKYNKDSDISCTELLDLESNKIIYVNRYLNDNVYGLKRELYYNDKKTFLDIFKLHKDELLKDPNNKFVEVNFYVKSDEFGLIL